MATKKRKLTEDGKLRRRAAKKAEQKNAKAIADVGPLFVSQIPPEEFAKAEDEYWAIRRGWALCHRGEEAAYLAGVDSKVDVYLIRRLAQRFMSAGDYAVAVKASNNHGTVLEFWKRILLGRQRIVLSYWRHVFGCTMSKPSRYYSGPPFVIEKQIECDEDLVWPPAGYVAPLTKEQLEAYLALPIPVDLPGQLDPLGLG